MSHILLIEDNQGNADMITHILQSANYEVKHFLLGLEGAKSARKEKPSMILMDFNLPDVDGRTLTLLLKKQLVDVPIVACSARTGDNEVRLAAKFGCAAFLSKPFTPEELLSLVKQMLKNAEAPKPPSISTSMSVAEPPQAPVNHAVEGPVQTTTGSTTDGPVDRQSTPVHKEAS